MSTRVPSIPSARRLISSLRDLGYGLGDAVAEIVDNSIEAGSNFVQLKFVFDGEDSYLLVMDNGRGMSPLEIQEAMRFGSTRNYDNDDLGRFGLGLKTASLSQCDELTVSSRQSIQRARINSFMWSMGHVTKVDKWEILKVKAEDLPAEVIEHLTSTVGTVVYWRRLSRLMGYRWPSGKHAEHEASRMIDELKLGLGATFHRFLSGELGRKRTGIFVNGQPVKPWDPFCRAHPNSEPLPPFEALVSCGDLTGKIVFRPFLLPTTRSFSSPTESIYAGGLKKWNKQQGFYIYRAGRLLQSGGWSGLRTADEHTKLVRVLVDIPPGMDALFKVNISKMKVSMPREVRGFVMDHLSPVIKAGQEKYRSAADGTVTQVTFRLDKEHLASFAADFGFEAAQLENFVTALSEVMSSHERRVFLSSLRRCARQFHEANASERGVA